MRSLNNTVREAMSWRKRFGVKRAGNENLARQPSSAQRIVNPFVVFRLWAARETGGTTNRKGDYFTNALNAVSKRAATISH